MRVPHRNSRSGFTLAEVVVTLLIVSIALTQSVIILNRSLLIAAHTTKSKVARELALYTIGQVASGLWWDEIDTGLYGTYSELGYDEFAYELVLGDESFTDYEPDPDRPFDNWEYTRELAELERDYDDEDEDEATQPYEKVRIKVTFPSLSDWGNEVVMEQWIPWEQVYGEEEEAEEDALGELPDGDQGGGGGESMEGADK